MLPERAARVQALTGARGAWMLRAGGKREE